MMSELFDEEYLREQYNKSMKKEIFAEGKAEGRVEGRMDGILSTLVDLVKKGFLTLSQAAEQANMSVTEFESKTGLN